MPEAGGLDLLREWQSAMQSVIRRQLLGPLKRQTELIQDVLERERKLQRRGIKTLREPADLARTVAGLDKRAAKQRPAAKRKQP